MIRLEGITGGIILRMAAGSFSLMSGLMKLAAEAGVTAPEMMFYRAIFGLPVVLAWVMMGPGLKAIATRRPLRPRAIARSIRRFGPSGPA